MSDGLKRCARLLGHSLGVPTTGIAGPDRANRLPVRSRDDQARDLERGSTSTFDDDSFAFFVAVPLTATFLYFLSVFSFGLSGDLAARESMYPARMLTCGDDGLSGRTAHALAMRHGNPVVWNEAARALASTSTVTGVLAALCRIVLAWTQR